MPEVTFAKFDLLAFWDEAARPRCDDDNNVLESAKFPILAMFARVDLSADSTSCQSERDFSALTFVLNDLRRSMREDRVEMIMFLNLNRTMIPEIRLLTARQEEVQLLHAAGVDRAVKAQAVGAGQDIVVVD